MRQLTAQNTVNGVSQVVIDDRADVTCSDADRLPFVRQSGITLQVACNSDVVEAPPTDTPEPAATNTATPPPVPPTTTPTNTAIPPTATATLRPIFNGGCFDAMAQTGSIQNASFVGDSSLADSHVTYEDGGLDGIWYFAVPLEYGKQLTTPGGPTGIEWCFRILEAGTYTVYGLFYTPEGQNHDSFFMSVDNTNFERIDVRSDDQLRQFPVLEDRFLIEGEYIIKFMHRESLTRLYGIQILQSEDEVTPAPSPTATPRPVNTATFAPSPPTPTRSSTGGYP
ncbi:MAG: hypothetical protein AAF485_03575 [Chloroflexota bacterium]